MDQNGRSDWYDDYAEDKDAEDKDELQIEEYDISASPNDFNVMTLHSFVDSGSAKRLIDGSLDADRIRDLEQDKEFSEASSVSTTSTANVKKRLDRAAAIVRTL